jgi:DNA-binding MarR family transcriptional regulator
MAVSKSPGPGASDPATTVCNTGALRRASRRLSQLYDDVLAPTGLRITQYALLNQIDRTGPAALSELAAYMVMDRSTLGHNLRPLERDGLVELLVDPDDRRSRLIGLTRAGRERLKEARPYWKKANERFENAFGSERAASLRALLQEVYSSDFVDKFTRQ